MTGRRRPAAVFGWLFAAAMVLLPGLAAADERILAYDSMVEVRADGSLEVTEHIRVRAEGSDIRRGIYRDFPTRYRGRDGNRVVVGFDVLGVERDGRPEPWFTESVSNGVRVNTGNDDVLPVPLETTYTLRYRTTRQLGFFEGHDELYWNAIGHGWAFPIDSGSVEVRLPAAVPGADMAVEGYSGRQGSRGQDFTAAVVAPGVARWTLAAPLQPREGLTIVLSFPKGVVTPPTQGERMAALLVDNLSIGTALLGLLVLLGYCLLRWLQIGRDPGPGVIIARYEPPRGESPAALRYMLRRRYDTTCMSSDLLACAVGGAVHIDHDKGLLGDRWTLRRGDVAAAGIANADQRRLLEALLPASSQALELEKKNAMRMQKAKAAHERGFRKRFQPAMFRHNGGSIAIALAIFGVTAVASFLLVAATGGGGLPWMLPPLALALAVTIAFAFLVGAPTAEGRRLLDEIEGFKRYLSVAEQDDIARLEGPASGAPPPLDAARFEALLPYAVALGVEKAWTEKFTAAVGTAAAAAATAGIAWYHGSGGADIGRFTSSIGSALSSQIASSSTPPGSSSGGGGGGFSGGGGGGGGGGGR